VKLGMARPVHLVNGLDREYTVDINGRQHRLGPRAREKISVAEGKVTLRILDEKQNPAPRSFSINTSFFTRPFDGTVHVINPDGTAMLLREEVVYSAGGSDDAAEPELLTGKFYYAIKSVDYAFEPAPQSLKVADRDKRIIKTHLEVVRDFSMLQQVSLLFERKDMQAACDVLRNRLELMPEESMLLMVATQIMPSDQAAALFRTKLSIRPVLVDWHRAYQEVIERAQPDHDVRGEYARLLEAEPDNAVLCYLLGRVTTDHAAARQLYRKAAAAKPPVAYAFHAMAYDAMVRGEFQSALDNERQALALEPDNPGFKAYELDALLALGRYDELLAMLSASKESSDEPMKRDVSLEVYLLARKGDRAGARQRAQQYCDSIRDKASAPALESLRADFDALLAYVQRDADGYATALRVMQQDHRPLERALHSGKFAEAMEAARTVPSEHAWGYLLIYLAAHDAGDTAAAKTAFDAAQAALSAGGADERLAGQWLAGTSVPAADALLDLHVSVDQKKVILASLGLRQPSIRSDCFSLARKLNYDTRFPHQLIDRITSK
jgi:hypothetical protein